MRLGSVDAGGRAEFRVLHHADGVAVAFVTRHAASVAVTRVGVEAAGGPGGALATVGRPSWRSAVETGQVGGILADEAPTYRRRMGRAAERGVR